MATLIKQLVCHSTLTPASRFRYCKLSVLNFFNWYCELPLYSTRDQRSGRESRREKVPDSKQWWCSAFWAPAIPKWGAGLGWAELGEDAGLSSFQLSRSFSCSPGEEGHWGISRVPPQDSEGGRRFPAASAQLSSHTFSCPLPPYPHFYCLSPDFHSNKGIKFISGL